MTEEEKFDVDGLPPTQYLVLDVLAARYRLGHSMWSFPRSFKPFLQKLADAGLVGWRSGPDPDALQTWLTDAGREASLDDDYETPEQKRARTSGALQQEAPVVDSMQQTGFRYRAKAMELQVGDGTDSDDAWKLVHDLLDAIASWEQTLRLSGYGVPAQAVAAADTVPQVMPGALMVLPFPVDVRMMGQLTSMVASAWEDAHPGESMTTAHIEHRMTEFGKALVVWDRPA